MPPNSFIPCMAKYLKIILVIYFSLKCLSLAYTSDLDPFMAFFGIIIQSVSTVFNAISFPLRLTLHIALILALPYLALRYALPYLSLAPQPNFCLCSDCANDDRTYPFARHGEAFEEYKRWLNAFQVADRHERETDGTRRRLRPVRNREELKILVEMGGNRAFLFDEEALRRRRVQRLGAMRALRSRELVEARNVVDEENVDVDVDVDGEGLGDGFGAAVEGNSEDEWQDIDDSAESDTKPPSAEEDKFREIKAAELMTKHAELRGLLALQKAAQPPVDAGEWEDVDEVVEAIQAAEIMKARKAANRRLKAGLNNQGRCKFCAAVHVKEKRKRKGNENRKELVVGSDGEFYFIDEEGGTKRYEPAIKWL